jgi:hypothetical protein
MGTLVESLGASPTPIVVEQAMDTNAGGRVWAAGTKALVRAVAYQACISNVNLGTVELVSLQTSRPTLRAYHDLATGLKRLRRNAFDANE